MNSLEKAHQMFEGKKVLVMGLGLLGGAVGDIQFLCDMGAVVRVTDRKSAEELQHSVAQLQGLPVEFIFEDSRPADIEWADMILRNPSIPYHHSQLDLARSLRKPFVMRSSLFAQLTEATIVGITGTRGKTTTTMMIYEILKACIPDKRIFLGGNIAHQSDLQLLKQITQPHQSIVVMELSSWQLQGFRDAMISPHVAVVTNLYPDHLNSYADLDTYYADKQAITAFQTSDDYLILNARQPEFLKWSRQTKAKVVWFETGDMPDELRLQIYGPHNQLNAAAAIKTAELFGVAAIDAARYLNTFSGVPYRQQKIAVKNGVTYINDTTATTPVAAAMAVEVYPHAIFIIGGSTKNLPTDELVTTLNQNAKKLILLTGNGTDEIKSKIKPELIAGEVTSMAEAVISAAALSVPGDTVVLSPGFTSFGLFSNEFDRGDQFNACVQKLP